MTGVTRILSAIEQGDSAATNQLLPLVYDELRRLAAQKLAHEKPERTLWATALVHEAYVRLIDGEQTGWVNTRHFLGQGGHTYGVDNVFGRCYSFDRKGSELHEIVA